MQGLQVVALAGGVGGAKLVDGLARHLSSGDLTVIVNTADDFEHFGLKICPDLDTVCYTLAGIASRETGWGRADESWRALDSIKRLGGPDWFRLGDRDLGTHLERTRLLNAGQTLGEITQRFCHAWGITHRVLPMTDHSVATRVITGEGDMAFQKYFVRLGCEPPVQGFHFTGVDQAVPTPGVLEAIATTDLVVIGPSNPWVSIDPILAIPGIRQSLEKKPVLAVTPLIGGAAVKGPAAKMYAELGMTPSALTVAGHYGNLLSGFVLDCVDVDQEEEIQALDILTLATDTLMKTPADRRRLAGEVLQFARQLVVRQARSGES